MALGVGAWAGPTCRALRLGPQVPKLRLVPRPPRNAAPFRFHWSRLPPHQPRPYWTWGCIPPHRIKVEHRPGNPGPQALGFRRSAIRPGRSPLGRGVPRQHRKHLVSRRPLRATQQRRPHRLHLVANRRRPSLSRTHFRLGFGCLGKRPRSRRRYPLPCHSRKEGASQRPAPLGFTRGGRRRCRRHHQ